MPNLRIQTVDTMTADLLKSVSLEDVKLPDALLYSAMTKAENKVGGGEGLEGVYGSITKVGTSEVLNVFKEHSGFGPDSVLLDIGSGLGRPLLHAIVHSGVSATYGIEVDAVKCQKACPFVRLSVGEMTGHGIVLPDSSLPKFICAPIEQVPSLEPATHIYSAWEGFARAAMEAVGKLFSASKTAKAITIVQRSFRNRDPAEEMEELGFGTVRLVASMPVYMAGSRRRLMAYCFVRDIMPVARGSTRTSLRDGPVAASPAGDLSTMPCFQPHNVMDVLAAQARERAGAKAAASEQAQQRRAEEAGACDVVAGSRDSERQKASGRSGVSIKAAASSASLKTEASSRCQGAAAGDVKPRQQDTLEEQSSGSQTSDRTVTAEDPQHGAKRVPALG